MNFEKLFFWGYPGNSTEPHLGLWEPVANRFLLTLSSTKKARVIKMIASARYNLLVCDLRSADNYQENLLDNTCCESWTVNNKKAIVISKPYAHNQPIAVDNLVCVEPGDQHDYVKEKSWLYLCYHWLTVLEKLKDEDWYQQDRFIKKIFSTELQNQGPDYFDKIALVENHILRTLYLGQDLDQINHDIESFIVNTDSVLAYRLSFFNS